MKPFGSKNGCNRREFLVRSMFAAGTLVLTLPGVSGAAASTDDLVIPVDDGNPLSKVGGSVTVDSSAGPVIIIRSGENDFTAFSAVCTHKRGIVEYDAANKRLECPKHHSKFDAANGKVLDGPAEDDLPSLPAKGSGKSVIVSLPITK